MCTHIQRQHNPCKRIRHALSSFGEAIACSLSSCESVLADLRVGLPLLFAESGPLALEGGQASAEGAILLLSQVDWGVSLLFEFSFCSIDSLLAQHSENLGNVLAHLLDLGELDLGL